MEYVIGGILAVAVAGIATITGLDRSRAFYTTVLIIVGSYYVLFAVMGASTRVVWAELAFAGLVSLVATIGFKRNMWLVAAALVGHGIFDVFHHLMVVNPGVPQWWPGFCMTYDVVAGVWMALLLMTRSGQGEVAQRI